MLSHNDFVIKNILKVNNIKAWAACKSLAAQTNHKNDTTN